MPAKNFDGNAPQHEDDSEEEGHEEVPHLEEVVEVLQGLHEDDAGLGVVGVAVLQQQVDEVGDEEDEEGHGCTDETDGATRTDVLVVDVVHDVEDAQRACQEDDGEAEDEHPGVEQGVEAVAGVGPVTDDGSQV